MSNLTLFTPVSCSFLCFLVLGTHFDVDIQEASLGHLEHEAHLCAGVDPLVEALLGMGVDANEVAGGGGTEGGQQHQQLRDGQHGSGGKKRRAGSHSEFGPGRGRGGAGAGWVRRCWVRS